MKSYRVFTIENERVIEGALVESLSIKSAGIEIPAVLIGERGRGRSLGAIPVDGHPDPTNKEIRLMAASVGTTRSGKPKLYWADKATSTEKVIAVYRSQIGYRGNNSHTGDCKGWECCGAGCDATGTTYDLPESCPKCEKKESYAGYPILRRVFHGRPGEVLSKGYIAEGAAGRAGGGHQYVLLIAAGEVVRVVRNGRLYGANPVHYTTWNGDKFLSLTPEERDMTELF